MHLPLHGDELLHGRISLRKVYVHLAQTYHVVVVGFGGAVGWQVELKAELPLGGLQLGGPLLLTRMDTILNSPHQKH